jgi:uncharacterized protein (DUF362 family)
VAAVRGGDLAEMTRGAVAALGGIETVVHEGETVFIKPNMVTLPWSARDYNPFLLGECTKVEIVIAVVEECLRAGAREVIVGDGSQMPRFDWSGAVTLDGSTNLAREAARLNERYRGQVRLACLDSETTDWTDVPTGISLGRVAVSSLVTRADRVISVAVAKTHRWAYLTLALKNFIGITPLARYGWTGTSETTRVLLHRNDYTPRGFGRLLVDIASGCITSVDHRLLDRHGGQRPLAEHGRQGGGHEDAPRLMARPGEHGSRGRRRHRRPGDGPGGALRARDPDHGSRRGPGRHVRAVHRAAGCPARGPPGAVDGCPAGGVGRTRLPVADGIRRSYAARRRASLMPVKVRRAVDRRMAC